MSKILIVEDEVIIRTALRKLLVRNKYDVKEAASVKEAGKFNLDSFNLIISDLRLPGAPGTDLIQAAGDVPVLIMTSYASLRSAVDSMRMGAVDYIAKPFDHDEMLAAVKRVLSKAEKAVPVKVEGSTEALTGMIGSSPLMKELYAKIRKVAPTNATVLINGETSTVKELVAKALHHESPRTQRPLISVNCAAIPETLIEAELFGHEKGAFTGAVSNRIGVAIWPTVLTIGPDGDLCAEGVVTCSAGGELGDDLEQVAQLRFGAAAQVVGREQVERRDLDVELVAPVEELAKLRRPRAVPVPRGPQRPGTGPPPVAVKDDRNVPRTHRAGELAPQTALVQAVEKPQTPRTADTTHTLTLSHAVPRISQGRAKPVDIEFRL